MKKLFNDLKLPNIIAMATFMDKLLFVFLVIFAIASFFFISELYPSGNSVRISVDNKTAYALPLHEDHMVAVKGPLGEGLIEIKDGKVHMKDAPCPDKLCVKQGWIDKGAIVCLPNKMVVTVNGGKQKFDVSEYDAVTR